MLKTAVAAAMAALVSMSCVEEFESYHLVTDFRLLAIAADKPDVFDGETATFSALTSNPDQTTYAWSWCPLPSGSAQGYTCDVTDAEIEAIIAGALGDDALEVPPLDLGSDASVDFLNNMSPEQGRALCDALAEFLPDGASVPTCLNDYFRYQIKVVVSDGTQEVSGIRNLRVMLNLDIEKNTNPTFTGVEIIARGTGEESGDGLVRRYDFFADASEDQSQRYVETNRSEPVEIREDLVFSWFSDRGEFDRGRTSYFEGERPIEQLNKNEWSIQIPSDAPDTLETRFWYVLRDERGGVSWMSATESVGRSQ